MGLKRNFGYNLLLTFCNYLFPLIVYPYVSRVLGVANIGICNFVDSFINYFILFSMLGIGSFGTREIARCNGNRQELERVFSSLITLNFMLTIVAEAALLVATLTIDQLQPYRNYLWVGMVKVGLNMFLIEWFFQGIEQFKYITVRSIVVRAIFIVSVFLFVHDADDVFIYYILTSAVAVLNSAFNWHYARRFVTLRLHGISLQIFLIPIIAFGYYRILTSMYTTFNSVYLGFVSDDTQVGYFFTATKIYTVLMGVFTAFTTVMIPRVSQYLKAGNLKVLQEIADKTFSVIAVVSLPLIYYCIAFAPEIIRLIAGPGYEGAILPFRIVIGLLLIIGFEQILVQQFLMASSSNRAIFALSTLGAAVGIGLNVLLTGRLLSVGASVAWGVSELCVLLLSILLVRRLLHIRMQWRSLVTSLLYSLLYLIPIAAARLLSDNMWVRLGASAAGIFAIFCCITLIFHKNAVILSFIYYKSRPQ